jgi:hypothetical protein
MQTTNTLSLYGYIKQMLLNLLDHFSPSLNGKSENGSYSTAMLTAKEEKAVTEELEKITQEITPRLDPAPDNQTAKWITPKVARTINPPIFKGFVHGLIPGFRFKNFIEPEEAEKISNAIRGYIEEYKTAPGVGRAGETLVEHPHDFDTYAELAAILRDPNISIPHRLELADKITSFLIRNTDFQFKPLRKGNIELFWGLFRQINTGAGWHLDNVTADSDAFKNRKAIFQGSGVLHIKTPKKGGETIMANRRAQDGDIKFLNSDGWTYDGKMLDGILKAEVPAVAGDLVFLSTLNYHSVKPCIEVGAERISFSMFFVIFEDEPNVVYYYN